MYSNYSVKVLTIPPGVTELRNEEISGHLKCNLTKESVMEWYLQKLTGVHENNIKPHQILLHCIKL